MNVAFTPSLRIKWDSIPTESLEHKLKGLMTFDRVATVVPVQPSQCVELAVQLRLIHAACSQQSASRQSACLGSKVVVLFASECRIAKCCAFECSIVQFSAVVH